MIKNEVFIIIVTYNGEQWIEKSLLCIKNSSIKSNVIIIDNNSSDETLKIVDNFNNIVVVPQSTNLGFGAANNIGISYALKKGAEYIVLLNQDVYIEENTIENLLKAYENNRNFGIISPIHLNGDGTKLDNNFANYLKINNDLFFDALQNNYTRSIYEVPFVNAAAWFIPKKTFEIVGGFDPIFFHYGEDDNFCQRVLYHKIKVGVTPSCFIYHDREYRDTFNNRHFSENKIAERFLKNKWANININADKEISNKLKYLNKTMAKLLLKLKFKKAKQVSTELKLIKKLLPEIMKSREINKTKGSHYLN